ncbi:MAG TPA: ABC transporter substrate-binding protein [Stellaceae bacterium]|nr:ABC transporter substrate-binding protein [Stellaceae bacterium]
MAIILQETLRGLFYAPFYACFALGAFAREGLDVKFASAPSPGNAPDGLFAGTVDVSWGGPMRVNQLYEARPDCDLVCIGEAVTRDPFFLVGREPRPNFAFADLYGRRVATVSEVPTPWLCLQDDLRRAGLDPDRLPRIADRTMAHNTLALRRGEIDVVQLFQPYVEELVASGDGHIWYAAASRGPTSYTAFYTRRSVLAAKREECKKLVRALYRTQKWLHANPPDMLAEAAQSYFPEVSPQLMRAAIARYRELAIWGQNPILPRVGYERLRTALVSGGFVRHGASFEQAVDNSLAEDVLREDPPALPAA